MTTTLYRLRDVVRVTGLSRTAIYRLEQREAFPARLRVSDEVHAWIDSRPRAVERGGHAT
jgi:predicted DNA-binding transcriptional regulator AlpA